MRIRKEAPGIPDQGHQQRSRSSQPRPSTCHRILFLVTASLLLSLEVLQGDLLHRVSLTLLLIFPLVCRGARNTLNDRKTSHSHNIQTRSGGDKL